jgi:hypothetical protein
MTEAQYEGGAELIDASGRPVAEVDAILWKIEEEGRGPRWGGRVSRPAMPEDPLPSADATYTLRLLDARAQEEMHEGLITPQGLVRMILREHDSSEQTVEVVGSGDPPF